MIRVEEINDPAELAALRLPWRALLAQTPEANFFQSLEWLEVYWRHFGAGQRLRVLVVYRGRHVLGIVPLVVRRERTRLGWVRLLTYPLDNWGSFFGPIGPSATASLLPALRHVQATPRTWDVLDLRWVPLETSDRGRTECALAQTGLRPQEQPWADVAEIDLRQGWEHYWAGRSPKFRKNVDRLQRRLAERGRVEHLRYRPLGRSYGDGAARLELFDDSSALAERSWQGGSTSGTTLSHPHIRGFLRELHLVAAEQGTLDANLLLLDKQPIAFAYNYRWGTRVFGLRMGFDPAWKWAGPGSVLHRMMLEDSCRRGDTHFDLGAAYLDAKQAWRTGLRQSYRYACYPPLDLRAQLLRLKRWWSRRVESNSKYP